MWRWPARGAPPAGRPATVSPAVLQDAYAPGHFGLSFELFPPKTPESEAVMWRTVDDLMAYEPAP